MASKYTVSALKHRPQRFSEVLAQDHVTRTLKHSLERGQIANAYLFAGSRGTGKTTTARLLAKALNCENPSEAEPCNECQNCVAINSGTFIDVLEIDAASNRGIDEIRSLRDIVRFSPTQGKYKVYIIDEVHMLTKEAYNAFLKTLEEPPSHSRFIMATTELQKVPNTILSRCQRFQFRRIPIQIIIEHLKHILDQQTELEIAEPEEMDRIFYHIARASEGGLRDALVSMDQLLAFCSGKLNLAEVEEILGVIEFDLQNRFVSAMIQHDLNDILAVIEELSNRGNDMEWFLKECLQFMRNLAVSKIAKDTRKLIDMPDEYRAQIKNTADQTTIEQILYMTDILWEADFRMKNSHNTRLILEMAAFKAAKAGQAVKVEDILNRLSSGTLPFDTPQPKQMPQPAPTQPHPAPAQTPPVEKEEISHSTHSTPTPQPIKEKEPAELAKDEPAPPPTNPAPVEDTTPVEPTQKTTSSTMDTAWTHILAEIEKQDPILAAALHDSKPLDIADDTLQIQLPAENSFHLKRLESPANKQKLLEIVKDQFGRSLKIAYEISKEPVSSLIQPEEKQEAAPKADMTALFEKLQQNPLFNKLQEELPGRITGIEPE